MHLESFSDAECPRVQPVRSERDQLPDTDLENLVVLTSYI
jgi:hypothetical protein